MFYLGAILLIGIGITHSYLGEQYILIRLFRLDKLPKLFGSTEFTKNTLRFAWHLTTIAWFGFAALLLHLSGGNLDIKVIGNIIGGTFILHSVFALIGSKGKHFSWPVFLVIGLTSFYASNA
ncbi:MAG: hypothetical protein V7749_17995 [Cocleimonas sp.]